MKSDHFESRIQTEELPGYQTALAQEGISARDLLARNLADPQERRAFEAWSKKSQNSVRDPQPQDFSGI